MADQRISPAALASPFIPNLWDLLALVFILLSLVLIVWGAHVTNAPLSALDATPISLAPAHLADYALRTTLRMLLAIVFSLLFTFIYATVAAKSPRAERVMIPVLDILQSVPILGFLTFTVVFFLNLFPGRVLGAELASVFAIFTSQAWNMAFSMFQSLKNIPQDLDEAAASFHLTPWQRFWRLEVPFATPGLVWNTMMSMSGGWFFVVASEAITVGNTSITLPGLGSYVALAIEKRNLAAILYAVGTMLAVIVAYDQLLFRPIVAWADKFRFEQTASENVPHSWMLDLFRQTRALRALSLRLGTLARGASKWPVRLPSLPKLRFELPFSTRQIDLVWNGLVLALALAAMAAIYAYLAPTISSAEVGHAFMLGLYTLARVAVLMVLATIIWVPVGVWIGLRPRVAERLQPLVQFLAAFPANIAFPVFVVLIVRYHLSPNVWLSPLMILGTQWYILFNVIAGASAFPTDLREAARSFHFRGWRWWLKVMLPGIFPYYVTGAITASGGCWNAALVAEVASWGSTKLTAAGLGSYIAEASSAGDFQKVVLGIAIMSLMVTMINRALWRPLYKFSERRLTM
ncbi:MAG: ABC transporter permease subunit [Hyphomicrobiales bacterium]|nr:ABC transporter permease subunit [Hyphomicrobiales bacterium]